MKGRTSNMFTVYRAYKTPTYDTDCSVAVWTESAATMSAALTACAIYLEDPDCVNVKIWRRGPDGEMLFDYWQV